jgi:hypothetical protein
MYLLVQPVSVVSSAVSKLPCEVGKANAPTTADLQDLPVVLTRFSAAAVKTAFSFRFEPAARIAGPSAMCFRISSNDRG